MKKALTIIYLLGMTSVMWGQGIINFQNSGQTLVSVGVSDPPPPHYIAMPSSTSGQTFYFALLTSATPTGTFTFTGLYATNTAAVTGGRLAGGNGIQVPGWGAGLTMSYEIAGWDASLGTTFNPSWLTAIPAGYFGVSPVATGAAGGTDALGNSLPPYNLFGGATGIPTGFDLGIIIPEPSSITLACLGAAALLVFRRRRA